MGENIRFGRKSPWSFWDWRSVPPCFISCGSHYLQSRQAQPSSWMCIGLVLYLAGCAFVLWARRTLGKMWGISTSQSVKLRDDHQIIQSGPYAFVRNPMYFGWWVAMFGLLLLYPVWMVLLMFLFSMIAFIGRAHREDTALAERFGDAWTEYKKHTKFLIPFIY